MWPQAPENMKDEPFPHYWDHTEAIADKEVVRAKMTQATSGGSADLFTVTLAPAGEGAKLMLAWGAQTWFIEIQSAR